MTTTIQYHNPLNDVTVYGRDYHVDQVFHSTACGRVVVTYALVESLRILYGREFDSLPVHNEIDSLHTPGDVVIMKCRDREGYLIYSLSPEPDEGQLEHELASRRDYENMERVLAEFMSGISEGNHWAANNACNKLRMAIFQEMPLSTLRVLDYPNKDMTVELLDYYIEACRQLNQRLEDEFENPRP